MTHFHRTSIELDTPLSPPPFVPPVPSPPTLPSSPLSSSSTLPSSSQQRPYLHLLAALYNEAKSMFSIANARQTLYPHFTSLKKFFTDFSLQDRLTRRQRVYLMLFGGFLSALLLLYKLTRPPPKRITFASLRPSQHPEVYDVIVVGAGPSGTSCAFHLAKKGKKVLLLEKKAFPRDKYCGEAVTHYAQEQLQEMGVLQGILDDNLAHSVDVGGFVSPCGNSFVGSSRSVMDHLTPSHSTPPPSPSSRPSSPRPASPAPAPSATSPPSRPPSPRPHSPSPASPPVTNSASGLRGVLTIKRIELDFRLAKAAQQAGAVLVENMNVQSADFDDTTGVWTVECKEEQQPTGLAHRGSVISLGSGTGITSSFESTSIPIFPPGNETPQEHTKVAYHGRALVCADGASSRLARSLGVVHSEPTAVCSRSYVQPPHAFKWDALLFYPSSILPGCCAIVRQVGGELSYLTFVNPAIGGLAKEEDLSRLHHEFIKTDPYISQALGPFIYLERMKAASLRIGGVGTGISLNNFRTVSTSRTPTSKDRSYGDHLLVVGDAAGFVDPFTGLGIQYALEGGKIAAGVLLEGFYHRDLSVQFLSVYEKRWEAAFGNQFYWSLKIGQLLCRFPILLDAMAKLIQRRGDQFLAEWMQAMTGTRNKTWFLSVAVWPFLFIEIILELIRRQFKNR